MSGMQSFSEMVIAEQELKLLSIWLD